MKITYLRALLLVMLASFMCTGCRPVTNENEPLQPDTLAAWSFTADYTENPYLAADAPWEMVKVGLRVGENLDSLIEVLGKPTPALYLVLEFTDTISSVVCHYLPTCWKDVPAGAELADTVAAYTTAVMQQARSLGVEVVYVQLSRCIDNGFLWATAEDQLYPARSMSDNKDGWMRFGQYLSAVGKAVHAVYPNAKVVLQTQLLGRTNSVQQQLSNLLLYWELLGVKYDALSFYYNPALQGDLSLLHAAFDAFDRSALAGREIHFETCFPCTVFPEGYGELSSDQVGYPYSRKGQEDFLTDCFHLLQSSFPAEDNVTGRYFIYRYASSLDSYQLANPKFFQDLLE